MTFYDMVDSWFQKTNADYNAFIKAMLLQDVDAMNEYMSQMSLELFSSFAPGKRASTKGQTERFYHGFVLGVMVDLQRDYVVTSK